MADETPDLRSTIEAAFEKEESNAPAPVPAPPPPPPPEPAVPDESVAESVPADHAKAEPQRDLLKAATPPAEEPSQPEESQFRKPIDPEKPPASWKPVARAKWAEVPLEARMEVHRRDREVTKVLTESATARQTAQRLHEAVGPYAAHIQARGAPSVYHAVNSLLQADYTLSNAPAPRKAEYMAQLIKDYGIDIRLLDSALAGEQVGDPNANRLEQLLQERLRPLDNFLQQQTAIAQRAEQTQTSSINSQLNAMEDDPVKYPHFQDVREDMADLIELGAKRGLYFSLDQAYSRAVAINPSVRQATEAKVHDASARTAAAASQARADKAKSASVSVSGAPVVVGKTVSPNDLRGTIEAAVDALGGR